MNQKHSHYGNVQSEKNNEEYSDLHTDNLTFAEHLWLIVNKPELTNIS